MATGAPRSPEDEAQNRWFFTREQLLNSPSRSDGVDVEKELTYRQQAASLIKNMGDSLKVYVSRIATVNFIFHGSGRVQQFRAVFASLEPLEVLYFYRDLCLPLATKNWLKRSVILGQSF